MFEEAHASMNDLISEYKKHQGIVEEEIDDINQEYGGDE
jgi:hypothetical protein